MRILSTGALALLVGGCVPADPSVPTPVPAGIGQLQVHAAAGPVCPVETEFPDPGCDPRPVAGAAVFVQPGDGRDILVGQSVTDANGVASFDLPAGEYLVLGGDVEGLFGRPEQVRVFVREHATAVVTLTWDTGVR